MSFEITIENTGESFRCSEEDNVLKAMEQLRRKGIPVGCRNGGCGVCKVQVVDGHYAKKKMSRVVVSEEEEGQGCVLAWKIYPQSNLRVRVTGKMVRAVVAQKSASFSGAGTCRGSSDRSRSGCRIPGTGRYATQGPAI